MGQKAAESYLDARYRMDSFIAFQGESVDDLRHVDKSMCLKLAASRKNILSAEPHIKGEGVIQHRSMLWIAKDLDVDVHELTTRKAETDMPIKRLACWPVTQAHTGPSVTCTMCPSGAHQ